MFTQKKGKTPKNTYTNETCIYALNLASQTFMGLPPRPNTNALLDCLGMKEELHEFVHFLEPEFLFRPVCFCFWLGGGLQSDVFHFVMKRAILFCAPTHKYKYKFKYKYKYKYKYK